MCTTQHLSQVDHQKVKTIRAHFTAGRYNKISMNLLAPPRAEWLGAGPTVLNPQLSFH